MKGNVWVRCDLVADVLSKRPFLPSDSSMGNIHGLPQLSLNYSTWLFCSAHSTGMRGNRSSPPLLHFHCTAAKNGGSKEPNVIIDLRLPRQFVQGGDLGATSGTCPVLKAQISSKFSTQLLTDRAVHAAAVLEIGLCLVPGPLAILGFSALVPRRGETNTALCPKSNAVRWRVPTRHSSQRCSISIHWFTGVNRP